MRCLSSVVCVAFLLSSCAADGSLEFEGENQGQGETRWAKPRTIYDGLYTREEIQAALPHPELSCSVRIDSRLNCASDSYKFFLSVADDISRTSLSRPFLVSDLLRLLYALELSLVFDGHEAVSREAFVRHYWSFVISRNPGTHFGLSGGDMLEYLASMQAWWQLVYRDRDALRDLLLEARADSAFEMLWYKQSFQNGATLGRPVSWGNWAAGSTGYAALMQARENGMLGDQALPLLYRYCTASGDYAFAIVTWKQDSLLEAPSPVDGSIDPECGDSEMVTPLIYDGQVLH
ncbi:MAG: hypothetical protein H6715_04065 [Myxococcales bacterium]|nr:hypothetical protein [Myxococcales bacterium]MCB9708621.1 hypothetical protein [Myxococcales bacterium]